MARFRGELKELPSSCGGSLAVSLTVSRSESNSGNATCEGGTALIYTGNFQSLDSPKSELSLLSKNNLLPTRCTMMSQELTERVQHISVARMASVANTLP